MAPSESSSKQPRPSRRTRVVCVSLVVAILAWDATAYAINALVSQDLPVLIEIAATEAASHTELVAILSETAAMVKQVKEYTTIAKTAWGALEELRQMTLADLANAAKIGLGNAFPELQEIYGDIKDIRDLNYRDERALQTLRGMLWEEVYGPGIDYLHSAHSNFEAVAQMEEHRFRQAPKIAARRSEAEQWEEDCKRTSSSGEGACQAAASRAAIQQALLLSDLHETSLKTLEAQERLIANADRRELDSLYAYDRWMFDLRNYFASAAGIEEECIAGSCLYERYGDKMYARVSQFRARHAQRYDHRISPPTEE
jgi:hypothetical protein